uniref:translation initiation factor IF-2-like n=1 Tax=Halichoerus grypus TaxID=9711 RepID=UPI001658D50A|nr:translation initiation factor IF-2-like [Halichoerus grypus]
MIMKKKDNVSLSSILKETKEAWRAPGAEDPSFNTFAVPLTPIHSFADDLGYQGSQELTSTRSPCVAGWVGESTLSSLSDSPGKKTPASPRPGGGSGARGRTRCRRRTRPAGPRARAVPEAGAEAVPGLAGARAAAEGAPQRPGEQRQHARVPGRGFAPQPGRLPPGRGLGTLGVCSSEKGKSKGPHAGVGVDRSSAPQPPRALRSAGDSQPKAKLVGSPLSKWLLLTVRVPQTFLVSDDLDSPEEYADGPTELLWVHPLSLVPPWSRGQCLILSVLHSLLLWLTLCSWRFLLLLPSIWRRQPSGIVLFQV